MTCPTVTATRSLWVVELLRRFTPVVRAALPLASYDDVMGLIVAAANLALDTGRDIEAVVVEMVNSGASRGEA